MGKIRTALVKRTARKLLEEYPDFFSDKFEENKVKVSQLLDVKSKKMRNRIAGYITHLVKIRRKIAEMEEQVPT